MMLTRQQVESLCLGCGKCSGLRIEKGYIYRLNSTNIVQYLSYYAFEQSFDISYTKFLTLNKIENVIELKAFLSVNYPGLTK